MKWEELKTATGNILERCWASTHSDRATSFSVKIGAELYSEKDIVTFNNLQEIFEYQKTNPHFNVQFDEKVSIITVKGAYDFYEWSTFDNNLTTRGNKKELDVGDILYRSTSDNIAFFYKEEIEKITTKKITFRSGYVVPIETFNVLLTDEYLSVAIQDSQFEYSYLFKETNYIAEKFNRQLLEEEFHEAFSLKDISNSKLKEIINIINRNEIIIVDETKDKKVLCKSCGESSHLKFVDTYSTSDLYYCKECEVHTQR